MTISIHKRNCFTYVFTLRTNFCKKTFGRNFILLLLTIFNFIFYKVASFNDSLENNMYDNMTLFYQNISDLSIQNETEMSNISYSDEATELQSPISVTEDSDNPFHSEAIGKLFLTPDEDICNCDLSYNVCDINCCCDPDCNEEDVKIFSECTHQVLTSDENYCYQQDIILKNNTVYKMVKNPSNGMFCIVHDNFKHQLRFKDMPVLKSHKDLRSVLKYKYKTTYSWDTESNNIIDSGELKDGSPIYIDDSSNKKTVTNSWRLPSSCFSDICSCNEEIRYLRDFQSSCSYVFDDLRRQCGKSTVLSAEQFTKFCVSLRSAPSHTANSLSDLIVHTKSINSNSSANNEYFSAQADKLCVHKKLEKQKISSKTNLCENTVSHIIFTVKHDGTNGITDISVDFKYANVSLSKTVITQTYVVNFVWSNVSEVVKKSGNPGYQVGLPIVAATNGSDFESEMLSKSFYENGLTVLDKDSGSVCSNNRQVIKFGNNLITGCILKHNFTSCKNLQNRVSDILLGPNKRQVFVGVFGNANISNSDDWIEVFHEPNELSDSDTNCLVSLGLKIQIVYAAVGTVANPQYKIVGVGFRESKPELVDVNCKPLCQQISLHTSVSFFDVTLPAVEHFAKIPSIKANLPSDFFYPFFYGRSSKIDSNLCLVLILYILCYFNNKYVKN